MQDNNNAMLFIRDLVYIIREMDKKAKESQNDQFDIGRRFAFYEILSLIEQQAIAFGYDKKDIGMDDFNPDESI
jgi:hypothetical protein